MSTKIYNAFLIECAGYNQLFEIIQNMKKYCNETLYYKYFQRLIELNVEEEDMYYLKKENPALHWELTEVFYEDVMKNSKFGNICIQIYPFFTGTLTIIDKYQYKTFLKHLRKHIKCLHKL